ncbi:MAG TPA: glycine cleavage T C-terminal barrel domain-containing protein [Pirellulales bacterium]|nr:glycine cleavage T C-terminal barrel domain-containing protein [Pirellulales bacterium]
MAISHQLQAEMTAAGARPAAWFNQPTAGDFGDFRAEYEALVGHVGLVDCTSRTQLELSGPDRAKFLHNLSTQEIRKLPAGSGGESFLLDARGHVLGHVLVFCGPESIVLDTVAGQGELLRKHLDRYCIREVVTITDRSDAWGELLVAGAQAAPWLESVVKAQLPREPLAGVELKLGEIPLSVRRVALTPGGGFLVSAPVADCGRLWLALRDAGARPCGCDALEAARLEAGTPWYGRDISDKTLPQEVARDALAISFVKGCYIGQETVARIDALGHVNKVLSSVHFEHPDRIPAVGTDLRSEGQVAGQITSAACSPRLGGALGLAYLRRGRHEPGTKLESDFGPAEVVRLPV